jgi:hypothetical protein
MIWVGLDSAHGFADKGINRLGTQLGVVSKAEDGQLHEVDQPRAILDTTWLTLLND